jgi:perosamine synthetase
LTTGIRIPVSQPCLSLLEHQLVRECLQRNQLSQGPMVARFEREFAEWLGVKHAIAVTSGTTALHLALVALGIGPGDEVLVPDLTFVATANAVSYTGAVPVLVDVDPATWCIDPVDIARKITRRSRAIIPVHLYGVPCDYSTSAPLLVIEDAAEGLGGSYPSGRKLGACGGSCDIGCFSFYANKCLTTGEGGMVVTDSDLLNERLRTLRGQGTRTGDPRYYHAVRGFNYRMTELQAALGVGQLSHLDEMLEARREVMLRYADMLYRQLHDDRHGGWDAPPCVATQYYAPWQFTFAVPDGLSRNGLAAHLLAHGIDTRPAFVPLHRLPMYQYEFSDSGYLRGNGPLDDSRFPNASLIGDTALSLPTYPDLPLSAVDEIAQLVVDWVGRARCDGALAT